MPTTPQQHSWNLRVVRHPDSVIAEVIFTSPDGTTASHSDEYTRAAAWLATLSALVGAMADPTNENRPPASLVTVDSDMPVASIPSLAALVSAVPGSPGAVNLKVTSHSGTVEWPAPGPAASASLEACLEAKATELDPTVLDPEPS